MAADSSSPIRIVLVDDHTILRASLRTLIEQQASLVVVGEAANKAQALAVMAQTQPDLVLLDLDLGTENALEFLPELVALYDTVKVLVLTGIRDPALHDRAIRSGAVGLVFKEQAVEMLLLAITKVHAGEVWLPRSTMTRMLTESRRVSAPAPANPEAARIAALTAREREIAVLISSGLGTTQLASRLGISTKTVRNHLASIYTKLPVSDRLELALYAMRHGLTSPTETPQE